jgi:tRNA(Ile2) C34 agmatinyltransferase TiaS
MLVYMGFDDTDVAGAPMGTGRLTRLFAESLKGESCVVRGILRHQLPRLEGIPYTSNNSSACVVLEINGDHGIVTRLTDAAVRHLAEFSSEGSDPGLCVVREDDVAPELVDFAVDATSIKLTQNAAMRAAPKGSLQGLGGTNDGIIGAAAAVGLTRHGWCGRFIEYGELRSLTAPVTVADLNRCGVRVISTDRDPVVPRPSDQVLADGWIRPSLLAGQPVLQVAASAPGQWTTAHAKRKKQHQAS